MGTAAFERRRLRCRGPLRRLLRRREGLLPGDPADRGALPASPDALASLLHLPGGVRLDGSGNHRDRSPFQLHSHRRIRAEVAREEVGIRTAGATTRALLQRRDRAAELRPQFDRSRRGLATALRPARAVSRAALLIALLG